MDHFVSALNILDWAQAQSAGLISFNKSSLKSSYCVKSAAEYLPCPELDYFLGERGDIKYMIIEVLFCYKSS